MLERAALMALLLHLLLYNSAMMGPDKYHSRIWQIAKRML